MESTNNGVGHEIGKSSEVYYTFERKTINQRVYIITLYDIICLEHCTVCYDEERKKGTVQHIWDRIKVFGCTIVQVR